MVQSPNLPSLTWVGAIIDAAGKEMAQPGKQLVDGLDHGWMGYYRMLAEESRGVQAPAERRVRLRVPTGIGRMNLLHLNVAADGTVEMLESEAESFLRAGWVRIDNQLP